MIRSAVEFWSRAAGFSDEQCRSVTLAVDEALTNVIRHAYDNRHDQPIALDCRRDDAGVEFRLRDHGRPVDLERHQPRPPDELRAGGRGIHFIRQIMDRVEYERLASENRLRLVKYRAKSGGTGS